MLKKMCMRYRLPLTKVPCHTLNVFLGSFPNALLLVASFLDELLGLLQWLFHILLFSSMTFKALLF